jgi:uncharacterized sulfatase
VPLIVSIPERFRTLRPADCVPGGRSDRLVSFVDFAPTMLSLAGIEPPDWMQGHAFLGRHAAQPQPFVFGFRGRMDERLDLARSVTDGRFVYVRNYMPHKIPGQHLAYMFETPTTQVWKRLHDEGKLNAAQDIFWQPKPPEELYDLQSDPDEVRNLAGSSENQKILATLRQAQQNLARAIRDVGFLPEGEIHARSAGSTPFDMGHDDRAYPFDRIFAAADLASGLAPKSAEALLPLLHDDDSAVRYWAATGLLMRGVDGVRTGRTALIAGLKDKSSYVRIACGEALSRFADNEDRSRGRAVLLELADWSRHDLFTVMAALNALDATPDLDEPLKQAIRQLPGKGPTPDPRYTNYVPRLLKDLN